MEEVTQHHVITGGDKHRVKVQARKRTSHTALQLRVVELSSVTITWPFTAHTTCCFFRTPRSAPHFTTQPRVQPNTERMQRDQRGDQATENACYMTPPQRVEERPRDKRGTGLGFPMRAPRHLGWWGAKRRREMRLTMSQHPIHSSQINFDDEACSPTLFAQNGQDILTFLHHKFGCRPCVNPTSVRSSCICR